MPLTGQAMRGGGVAGTVTLSAAGLSGVGWPAGAAERGASPWLEPGGGARPSRFTEDGRVGIGGGGLLAGGSP